VRNLSTGAEFGNNPDEVDWMKEDNASELINLITDISSQEIMVLHYNSNEKT
jgi:hypothetical protein